jgi:hypothetical protein
VFALGTAMLIAAVAFGSARGSGTQQVAVAQGSPDSVAGTPVSSKAAKSSPEKMYGYATPVRVPALRTVKASSYGPGRAPEPDFESYLARLPGSSTIDPVVQ